MCQGTGFDLKNQKKTKHKKDMKRWSKEGEKESKQYSKQSRILIYSKISLKGQKILVLFILKPPNILLYLNIH